jgi:hypothetical protein
MDRPIRAAIATAAVTGSTSYPMEAGDRVDSGQYTREASSSWATDSNQRKGSIQYSSHRRQSWPRPQTPQQQQQQQPPLPGATAPGGVAAAPLPRHTHLGRPPPLPPQPQLPRGPPTSAPYAAAVGLQYTSPHSIGHERRPDPVSARFGGTAALRATAAVGVGRVSLCSGSPGAPGEDGGDDPSWTGGW